MTEAATAPAPTPTKKFRIDIDYQDRANKNQRIIGAVVDGTSPSDVVKAFEQHKDIERINNISVRPL